MNKNNQSWFRKRGYLHFDSPISIQRAESIVKSPERVSKHSFYPLINYDVDSFKVFKNSNGLIEKKEKKRPIAYASHVDSHIYCNPPEKSQQLFIENSIKINSRSFLCVNQNSLIARYWRSSNKMKMVCPFQSSVESMA